MIVDEPMVGLDPHGARQIKDVFRTIADSGRTVFLSTHTLDVAEEVCDRIGIINKGRLVALGTMAELRASAKAGDDDLEAVFLTVVEEAGRSADFVNPEQEPA
jgi:ABC-2 type transport system ATP-binding protein